MPVRRYLLTGLALFTCWLASFAGIKEDIAKTVVRLRSGSKYSTAFFWKDGQTLIATLHGITDQGDTEVYIPAARQWVKATPIRVLKEADLVMLRVSGQGSQYFIAQQYTQRPDTDTKAFTVGYNGGNTTYQDRDFTVGLLEGSRLQDLLPAPVERQIRELGFPSLQTEIVYLKGQLLHGFSGAPVVDYQGKLLGVADGGLENGAAGVSWCISASHISRLENSGEAFPALNRLRVNSLFSADEALADATTVSLGNYRFRKTKTRTFAQLDETADYSTFPEMGLIQLLTAMVQLGIPFQDFVFDIYFEENTGATLVLPSGYTLKQEGQQLVARQIGGGLSYYIAIQPTTNGQQTSLQFEQSIVQTTGIASWQPDPRLSFMLPLFRPDNVVINRKAFFNMYPNVYLLEALTLKENTFFGVYFTANNALNLNTAEFYDPVNMSKHLLAVFLTTFSY